MADDPLAPLRVIDRLEVEPALVDARGLSATYRVVCAGRQEVTELRFSY